MQADLFLHRLNWENRESGVYWRLGKNMLWIEMEMIGGAEENSGIEINMSKDSIPPRTSLHSIRE